ncbi:DUF6510 family protein [Egicoccus sp. AB-alg2]|uniref:DUF6510 family protein n=1 Tax=Egicoccus sp. AB-alg2 TaxID=3242693 RepID=UPI00359EC287
MSQVSHRLDGNVAAGPLATLFAFDITTTRCTCATCGAAALFAEYHAYTDAPGTVVRCPRCEGVLVRLAETPGHLCVDLRGARLVDVADSDGAT